VSEVFRFEAQTQVSVLGPAYFESAPPVQLDTLTYALTLRFNQSMLPGLVVVFAKQDAFGLSLVSLVNVTLPYGTLSCPAACCLSYSR
jgi:hypothetical protein